MSFKKPNPKQNFYELESEILKWWKENNILEKSINQRPDDTIKTFYDGPITANGEPHTGHALTFSLKDVIPRYWSMQGYKVERSLGWDCHGIPVEYEIEKKLGFKEKKDIEKYGIEEFNKLCRESVIKYQSNIIDLEESMGRLTNDAEEYATMDKDYIESVWWSLKELYEKELLYEGFKVVPYSTRAGTTLSNAEVALGGYKKIVDPSIVVKFQLVEETDTYLLAWTTTPWTIPSNLGIAINPEIIYTKVKEKDSKEMYILAKDLIESVFKDKEYEVLENVNSDKLIGKSYNPPFDFFKGHKNSHKIFAADYVTTESGTGLVHLAPYGAEDNEVFQKEGIESFDVLDGQGDFTNQIEPYAGMFYKKANKFIIEDLKTANRLFDHFEYEHDMPMCWRTKTPLIYKPITSWYIAMSTLREQLVENNNTINWIPKHAREGRFGTWLAEIKDWGISRSRYWGTPLPVWKSESGKLVFIGSFDELKELSGVELEDPHRPFVDDITFEKDGETYKRIPDVIDVWYDSGAMPFARFHYPFENKEKFEQKFPAQYIAEGIDQTRGWFYTLHAEATALFDSVGFQNVIINGTITDDKGRKLSKSLGNYTPPKPLIERHGADTIRLNFFNSPLMNGEDAAVTDKTLKLQKQETMLPLWNIYSYLITYANIHKWTPRNELAYNKRSVTDDTHPWDHIPFDEVDDELDAWLIVKLQHTIKEVNESMNQYLISRAVRAIKDLISDTSKWYIRSNRQRFVSGDQRALDTLYYVFVEIIKLLAPFTPFISEHIYQELVFEKTESQKESVHLTDYPQVDEKFIEAYKAIVDEMAILQKLTEFGHMLRVENGLKVRQPLTTLYVDSLNTTLPEVFDWMEELLKNELNVKEVTNKLMLKETDSIKVTEDTNLKIKVGLDIQISDELQKEGLFREIVRNIQASRKKMGLKPEDEIEFSFDGSNLVNEVITLFNSELKDQVRARELKGLAEGSNKDEVIEMTLGEEMLKFSIRVIG